MEQSILQSTKKILGVGVDDDAFDLDILTLVNSAFATLHQLGIGPDTGFAIEDGETVWADFFETNPHLNQVKTYVYLKTRLLFDPPTNSFVMGALEKQISELEWRLNEEREQLAWTDPDPVVLREDRYGDPVIIDGGYA